MKATYVLIFLFVIFYLFTGVYADSQAVFNNFGFSGNNLREGRIWTLITSIFLHGSPLHIILNCVALFFFGRALESELSVRPFLIIFFLGGIVGNLFALFTYPAGETIIGASGAVFAVMGTGILLAPLDFVIYPLPLPLPLVLVGIVVAMSEVVAFLSGSNGHIAHISHLGGLLTGLAFGLREEQSKKGLIAIGIIFLILFLVPEIWPFISKMSYLKLIRNMVGSI